MNHDDCFTRGIERLRTVTDAYPLHSEGRGQGFESLRVRHFRKPPDSCVFRRDPPDSDGHVTS